MPCVPLQVFLVRKVAGPDAGQLYAMKVLKKATLKGEGCGRGGAGPCERRGCGLRSAGVRCAAWRCVALLAVLADPLTEWI